MCEGKRDVTLKWCVKNVSGFLGVRAHAIDKEESKLENQLNKILPSTLKTLQYL